MTIDITEIVNALLGLIAALITAYVVPWLKTKLTAEQQKTLAFWVEAAVKAAEQTYGSGAGEAKKQFVLEWLAAKNLSVDEVLIEAKVNELFGKTELLSVQKTVTGIPEELEKGVG